MSLHKRANVTVTGSLLTVLAVLPGGLNAQQGNQVVGYLKQISASHVLVEDAKLALHTFKIDSTITQCFDHRGDKTTCKTLAGVGYADKGRVTFIGDVAQRIDVIEMQQ
jgi:hypothetical protein